jgi:hypothetical protein
VCCLQVVCAAAAAAGAALVEDFVRRDGALHGCFVGARVVLRWGVRNMLIGQACGLQQVIRQVLINRDCTRGFLHHARRKHTSCCVCILVKRFISDWVTACWLISTNQWGRKIQLHSQGKHEADVIQVSCSCVC